MGKPVARGARLIAVGVALVGVSASLFVVRVNALDSTSIDRAELDDGVLRVEGERAVRNATVLGHFRRVVGERPRRYQGQVPGTRFQLPVEQLPGDGH